MERSQPPVLHNAISSSLAIRLFGVEKDIRAGPDAGVQEKRHS